MEAAAINAALWVVGKALAPVKDGLLEAWAATTGLAPNIWELKLELLLAEGMLDNARDREPRSPALGTLLHELRQLAYGADDVLDELDYFRIQDALDGTYHAADAHGRGCIHGLVRDACYTAKAVGKRFSCCSFPCAQDDSQSQSGVSEKEPPKLKFDRVGISERMKDIIDKLKPVCAKVSTVLNTEILASNPTTQHNAMDRPRTTTPYIIEPTLYGRDTQKKSIVEHIIHGEYSENKLTVLPIVGPGGIGKTTFTQHVYQEVKSHFDVVVWLCVSQNFNASSLAQEALKKIPRSKDEKESSSDQELIEQRLKAKRFLLVLDDVWAHHEDEWKKLLTPFRKGEEKGSVVIVTTRIPEVANMVKTIDYPIEMGRLEAVDFMKLFEACVFGDNQQPWKSHPELFDVGDKIVGNLKGNPLAAKTVGRLLRNRLSLDHWTLILESKEWELQTNDNDIMPALKLSYDYLPFDLKQCFSYFALFPEDYEFGSEELIHLWIGLGILHSSDHNKRIEDIGLNYLNDLVNHGFLKKNDKDDGPYYIVHDLLHELAVKVSSYECLSIRSSNMWSVQVSPYVRHLSIIIENTKVNDRITFENCKKEMIALGKRLKVENLRTLMLFGEHHGSFTKTLGEWLREARALRTIYLSQVSYNVDNDMLCNFSKLVHLRYLRTTSAWHGQDLCLLPTSLVRLYHLEVLDLQEWRGSFELKGHISNLVKLRHFLVPIYKPSLYTSIFEVGNLASIYEVGKLASIFEVGKLASIYGVGKLASIFEVGKLEFLQELRKFNVRSENGFELSQLGKLRELGGSLEICNLEKVQTKEEADGSKLIHKSRLHKLELEWNIYRTNKDPTREKDVLESLRPHSNLRNLCIRGHGGINCPTWLGANLCVKNLESLELCDVPWIDLPPLGDMLLVDESGKEHLCCTQSQIFHNLKVLKLSSIQRLRKWVVSCPHSMSYQNLKRLELTKTTNMEIGSAGNRACYLFVHLEVLIIHNCPELFEVPFFHPTCYQQEAPMAWFPRLQKLSISDCPKLLPLPPIPWTLGPCDIAIENAGSDFKKLVYKNNGSEVSLSIKGNDVSDSTFWKVLDFNNLIELKELKVNHCPPLPLDHLGMLSSLKKLVIKRGDNYWPVGESHARYQFPVESFDVYYHDGSGKELTRLLSCFPKLLKLGIYYCGQLTELGVMHQNAAVTPTTSPPSLDEKVGLAVAENGQKQQRGTERDELELSTTAAEGLVLLPPQLQVLRISDCPRLRLHPNSLHVTDNMLGEVGGGLQGLRSLRELDIGSCPEFHSLYPSSSSSTCFPFPTSLQNLYLGGGQWTLMPLSNLTSLHKLSISCYPSLGAENISLWPLLTQGCLTELALRNTSNCFLGPDPETAWSHQQGLPSKLRYLETDDIARVLATPICSLLSSSLTTLVFRWDRKVKRFTEEQEKALQLLTSLEFLLFMSCENLQCLPAGLHMLPNLKILWIHGCKSIQSLPKDGLPSSLQTLYIQSCDAMKSLPKEALPSSLKELKISYCSAILQSLHKDGIPNSLRFLDVSDHEVKDRMRFLRFKGTIPILRI